MDPFTINRIAQIEHEENVRRAAQYHQKTSLLRPLRSLGRMIINAPQKTVKSANVESKRQTLTTRAVTDTEV